MVKKTAKFGNSGTNLSRLGLGCMGMSNVYGASSDEESIKTIHRAIEIGCNFLDTADVYGAGHNEQLIAKAIQGKKDKVFIATKFGLSGISNFKGLLKSTATPEYIFKACDASLKRLGVDIIDLYYLHRLDKNTEIEETIEAMAKLIKKGKVRYLGLSEVSEKTLRRAHTAHPITALQSEYSLWQREVEPKILPACKELGIAFVPYAPLGRGVLTGKINSSHDFEDGDWRNITPRFQGTALQHNLNLVNAISKIAKEKSATPGQIALSWLLHQSADIFPIPGTKRIKYLEENWQALEIELSKNDLEQINHILKSFDVQGDRYPQAANNLIDRS